MPNITVGADVNSLLVSNGNLTNSTNALGLLGALVTGTTIVQKISGTSAYPNKVLGVLNFTNAEQNAANPLSMLTTINVPASRAVEGQIIRFSGNLYLDQNLAATELYHPALILATPNTLGPDVIDASGALAMLIITRPGTSVATFTFDVRLLAANGYGGPAGSLGISNGINNTSSGYVIQNDFAGATYIGSTSLEDAGSGENYIAQGVAGTIKFWFAADSVTRPGAPFVPPYGVFGDLLIKYDLDWYFVD